MQITLIAALDQQNGIGKNGTLPWHVPEDMSHFLRTTKGGVVVMGRKTFESLRSPLKGRENWVLSRTMPAFTKGFWLFREVESVLKWAEASEIKQLFIIGGSEIYKAFMPYATELIITYIVGDYQCDTFFPEITDEFKLVGMEDLSYNAKVCYYEKR